MTPGDTPLVHVGGIYAKLECANPCGSIKDRIAKYIIDKSEKRGLLKPGMRIIEATSGNTGIALSYFAAQKGYPITIVMPENMTDERKAILKELNAEVILCSAGNFAEAAAIRDKMAKNPEFFNPDQFSNPLNVECHYKTTGQEILKQIKNFTSRVDAFVAGVGTGGSLMGVTQALKEVHSELVVAAVEPTESAVMSGGKAGMHGIQGIGDGFIPPIVQCNSTDLSDVIDEVISVSTRDAVQAANDIQKTFGYCIGISSGANFLAAKKLAERFENVVTIFPDGYSKYQSHGLSYCGKGRCPYENGERTVFAYYKKQAKQSV